MARRRKLFDGALLQHRGLGLIRIEVLPPEVPGCSERWQAVGVGDIYRYTLDGAKFRYRKDGELASPCGSSEKELYLHLRWHGKFEFQEQENEG